MPARCTASLAVLNNAALFRSHVPGSSAAYGLRHDRSKTADTSLWKPRTTSNQVPAFLRRHCLRMRTPFELQNDFSVAILGLSKFFREDAAVTAQTMLIGNRPCRIYGEAHAEYLLLQMTGEHELQSMESEIAAIAQSAHHFLFAAIPVESWNDALSPWEAPAV